MHDAYATALTELHQRLGFFVRATDVRLFHIATTPQLRQSVVQLVMAQEFRVENTSAFLLFEAAHTMAEGGWSQRIVKGRVQHNGRRKDSEPAGMFAELPAPPDSGTSLAAFAQQLAQIRCACGDPIDGLVVVLAPLRVEGEDWQLALRHLVASSQLAGVRWIVVEPPPGCSVSLVERLGPAAVAHVCVIDHKSSDAAVLGMIDGRTGAGPQGVTPPARIDAPAEEGPSIAAASSVLRARVLGAAMAARDGNDARAILLQREAHTITVEAKAPEQAVVMQLVLGGYLLKAGDRNNAQLAFEDACELARLAGLPTQVANAQFALGALYVLNKDMPRAMKAYTRGAEAADMADQKALAVEGYRMAGQTAMDAGSPSAAIDAWTAAVGVADGMPAQPGGTCAPQVTADLVALLRHQGMDTQADELERNTQNSDRRNE